MRATSLLIGLLTCDHTLWAAAEFGPPIFGIELTFTNDAVIRETNQILSRSGHFSTDEFVVKQRAYHDFLLRVQTNARKIRAKMDPDGKTVRLRSGLWFSFNTDINVVEVQGIPMPRKAYIRNGRLMERLIFTSAYESGLAANREIGGGHLSLSHAFQNALQYRNFFVDFHNHPELATGVLHDNPRAAAAFCDLNSSMRASIALAIRRFDSGAIPNTIMDLRRELSLAHDASIEPEAYLMRKFGAGPSGFALNVEPETHSDRQIEIRSLRAQKNTTELLLLMELFERRIAFTNQRTDAIPFENQKRPSMENGIRQFKNYVRKVGLNWRDYVRFMSPNWQESAFRTPNFAPLLTRIEKRCVGL